MIGRKLRKITIALNVFYDKNKKIYPAYVLKQNSKREKQVIVLMIPNGEGWHYLPVKNYLNYQEE